MQGVQIRIDIFVYVTIDVFPITDHKVSRASAYAIKNYVAVGIVAGLVAMIAC